MAECKCVQGGRQFPCGSCGGQTEWLVGSGGGSILASVCQPAASINNTLHLRSVTVEKSLSVSITTCCSAFSDKRQTHIKITYITYQKRPFSTPPEEIKYILSRHTCANLPVQHSLQTFRTRPALAKNFLVTVTRKVKRESAD